MPSLILPSSSPASIPSEEGSQVGTTIMVAVLIPAVGAVLGIVFVLSCRRNNGNPSDKDDEAREPVEQPHSALEAGSENMAAVDRDNGSPSVNSSR